MDRDGEDDGVDEKARKFRKTLEVHPFDRNWVLWFFSLLTFSWTTNSIKEGNRRQLDENDMFSLPKFDLASKCLSRLEKVWDASKPTSFLYCVLKSERVIVGIAAFTFLLEAAVQLLEAFFLGKITLFFQEDEDPNIEAKESDAYLYALGIAICAFIHGALHHVCFFLGQRSGHIVRTSAIALIYKKSLRLGTKATNKCTSGHIMNLVSNDVERFFLTLVYINFVWIGPLQVVAAAFFLYTLIGPFCFVGLGFIVLTIPVHLWLSSFSGQYRKKTAVITDRRVRIMNELLSGMRVIKMYVWEKPFASLIRDIREEEIGVIRKTHVIKAINLAYFFVTTSIITYISFAPYVYAGNELTAYRVFTSLAVFGAVQLNMSLFFPAAVHAISELRVTCNRIEKYLRLPEHSFLTNHQSSNVSTNKPQLGSVAAANFSCEWEEDKRVLDDLSFNISPGTLVGVVGPVGAGKSTLFMAMLRELLPSGGHLSVVGDVSFSSQEAWILASSVKENILFGNEYDQARFEEVLHVCGLEDDMKQLPHGFNTVIGERGVTLSGGQKARLSLARAVYRDADIYFLDDPLSAVDTKVGSHMYKKCVCSFLDGKTRFLATHQVHHLMSADHILVLDEHGHLAGQGTFQELLDGRCKVFEDQVKHVEQNDHRSRTTSEMDDDIIVDAVKHETTANEEEDGKAVNTLFSNEDRHDGKVTLSSYFTHIKYMGSTLYIFVAMLFIPIAQALYIGVDSYLALWVNSDAEERDVDRLFIIYSILLLLTIVCAVVRALLIELGFLRSSFVLHNKMFEAILNSPIRFFDTNPVGRILNRFSKDLGYMDDLLPWVYTDFLQLIANVLGIVLLASIINPWIFFLVLPLLIVFLYIRRYFLNAAREVKRIEAVNRSPIYSHFSLSLSGLAIIRSHNAESKAVDTLHTFQNNHSKAVYMFLAMSRWLGFRLDFLAFIFITCVVFAAIAIRQHLNPGFVGLSLAYVLRLSGMFQWCVRQSAEVENFMTSVERAIEYSKLPSEESLALKKLHKQGNTTNPTSTSKDITELSRTWKDPPSRDWPELGGVVFKNVTMRYSDELPVVLKGIDLTIKPGTKVGIVGRTGAGKSSIIAALFRLAHVEGTLSVDGVDITRLSFEKYRKQIAVIPQDPTLFSGSVRYNLDPFNEFSDHDLWDSLETVQLKRKITSMDGKLDGEVQENGSNFSVGQKQLLCLARALLRRAKIIVIDEATANVDEATDLLIQSTIRQIFSSCTVFAIAHRLHTIMDSDVVVVMDGGKVAEADHPHTLLQTQSSQLSQLVGQLNKNTQKKLTEMAEKAFVHKQEDSQLSFSSFSIV
eukprot:m.191399 g.191399  ORF g.191399 m.191399 type:complete len:1327 (+) comp13645_c0_seq4:107-4087(+)